MQRRLTFDANPKELEVEQSDDPLDLYEHAPAYAPRRGHPGRHAAAAA